MAAVERVRWWRWRERAELRPAQLAERLRAAWKNVAAVAGRVPERQTPSNDELSTFFGFGKVGMMGTLYFLTVFFFSVSLSLCIVTLLFSSPIDGGQNYFLSLSRRKREKIQENIQT